MTCTPWACAPSRFPARPRSRPPAKPPSTAAASAGSSSGAPDQKAGSATSSTPTAGIAPGWMAKPEPPSGAGTEYSHTTSSKSGALSSDEDQAQATRHHHNPATSSSTSSRLFQVEVASGRTEKSGREKKKVHGGINGIPGVDAANYDAGSCLGSAARVHRAGPELHGRTVCYAGGATRLMR